MDQITPGKIGTAALLLLSESREGNSIGADIQSMTLTKQKSEA